MSEEGGTPAEVIELVGRTRNCRGPIRTGDVIVLLGTDREVRKLLRR
jgi:ribosomal protein S28E/S33